MLRDPRLDWFGDGVLDEMQRLITSSLSPQLSDLIPLPLLEASLGNYPADKWHWPTVSRRLSIEFLLDHLLDLQNAEFSFPFHYPTLSRRPTQEVEALLDKILTSEFRAQTADRTLFDWNWSLLSNELTQEFLLAQLLEQHNGRLILPLDYSILSNRPIPAVEELLQKILISDFRTKLGDEEFFDWDWSLLTDILTDDFVLAYLPLLPLNHYYLSQRGADFVQAALQIELSQNAIGAWLWSEVQPALASWFIWEHIDQLHPYLSWQNLIKAMLGVNSLPPVGFDQSRFLYLIRANKDRVFPLTTDRLRWTPALIDFFDGEGLLRWGSQPSSPGFEANQVLSWDALCFARYHSNVSTPTGRAYISGHIDSSELLTQYPDFAWDWPSLTSNPRIVWTTELIATYGGQLDWPRLLQRHSVTELTDRLHYWHELATATGPANRQLAWSFFSAQLPVKVLLTHYDTYAEHLDLVPICRRDPAAVADFLRKTSAFQLPWEWSYLAAAMPPADLIDLLPLASTYFERSGDVRIHQLTLPLAAQLPIAVSLEQAPAFRFAWDWVFVSRHITEAQLLAYLPALTSFVDWAQLTRTTLTTATIRQHLLFNYSLNEQLDWPHLLAHHYKPSELVADLDKLAAIISTFQSIEVKNSAWRTLTQRLPLEVVFPELAAPATSPSESQILPDYPFDWEVLSDDPRLRLHLTLRFVERYADKWHWHTLSKNKFVNTDRTYLLHPSLRPRWDWDYLSEFSQFLRPSKPFQENKPLYDRFARFIRWDRFSHRTDTVFEPELILEYRNQRWDWSHLSASPKLALKRADLDRLQQKPWDWAALSANTALTLSTADMAALEHHPWDWAALSRRPECDPADPTFIKIANKPLDFNSLSFRADIKWPKKILLALQDKLDWTSISAKNTESFSTHILEVFAHKINWLAMSSPYRCWSSFNPDWVKAFNDRWELLQLVQNNTLPSSAREAVKAAIKLDAALHFQFQIQMLNSNWKGYAYHFTHLTNALDIIRSGKILSRNKALQSTTKLADAAGSVVNRRHDAHSYARFYFRPQSPTQFYNEGLGMDRLEYLYDRAKGLNFPKCPIPVFFRFKLKEIFEKKRASVHISNGNMQADVAGYGPVEKVINRFDFENLFLVPERYWKRADYIPYIKASQQEMLILDELDFNEFEEVDIIVRDDSTADLLYSLLGENHKFARDITTDCDGIFHRKNAYVECEYSGCTLTVSPQHKNERLFPEPYTLIFSASDLGAVQDIEVADYKSVGNNLIFEEPFKLTLTHDIPFTITFEDEQRRSFIVYINELKEELAEV
ncbi:DUF4433 domain-containing protein [Hymenobacter qilianensis]|uniref:DUF4433 domain-containing protein n=1 Tax=Hymenobacter qilianensis TaxID=1385715 RepID=A0A7H0GT47_9BACT|nr:DarT ssDNA thymidine ADP-ribosyltransferase family protein [Hymenobacter qilianensis]QNP51463.1 DUF4433 domain-containing protein [Hymenobacter qilianensis]